MNITAQSTKPYQGTGVLQPFRGESPLKCWCYTHKAKGCYIFLHTNSPDVICRFLKELTDRIENERAVSPGGGPKEYLWEILHKQRIAYESPASNLWDMNWTEDEMLCNMIWFQSFKLIMSYPLFRLAACGSKIAPSKSTFSVHWSGRKQFFISLCLSVVEHHVVSSTWYLCFCCWWIPQACETSELVLLFSWPRNVLSCTTAGILLTVTAPTHVPQLETVSGGQRAMAALTSQSSSVCWGAEARTLWGRRT